VPESGTPGSVRGVSSNGHSYRDKLPIHEPVGVVAAFLHRSE
jgi:hypothetical protein